MKAGSIRLNLLAWLVAPGLLVLGIGAWLSYQQAQRLSTLVTDRQLIASARMIAEQIGYSEGSLRLVIPPAALELFASDSHDEVAYSVTDPNGVLLAGYPGLDAPRLPSSPVGSADSRYFDTVFRNEEAMRAVTFPQSVVTPTGTITVNVAVGETLKSRDALVTTLWTRGFLEQAALVVAGVISIWFGIARELTPLLRLRQEVRDRSPDQFEPFNADAVQSELRPMVVALNSHMDRLRGQIERQRRFLDSAAHQLRTPLAAMKAQIGYARRTPNEAEVHLALGAVDTNLSALARMTSQLLLLGRVDHSRSDQPNEVADMSEVAKHIVLESAHRSLDAGIELAFETSGPAPVIGSRVMLNELVVNLVENVILHAGKGAIATIAVRRAVREIVIRVDDNGIGVADEDRPLLLQRFQRGRNAPAGGSGLGLSIVAELAESLGGRVELPAPRGGKGFAVVVFLPASVRPLPGAGN
jgi:two-component system sensor histidine kinase TctE